MFRAPIFLLSLFILLLFSPGLARAEDITIRPGIPLSPELASKGVPGTVAGFYQFALLAGGLLAFGAIVYGALKYTAAAGNPSGQSDARDQITQALLGLLLLLGAYVVLFTINPNLTKLSLPALEALKPTTSTQPNDPCAEHVANNRACGADPQHQCDGPCPNADERCTLRGTEYVCIKVAQNPVDLAFCNGPPKKAAGCYLVKKPEAEVGFSPPACTHDTYQGAPQSLTGCAYASLACRDLFYRHVVCP